VVFFALMFNARSRDHHGPAEERDARTHEEEGGENFTYRVHARLSDATAALSAKFPVPAAIAHASLA
jgi:hypothetical protein